MIRRLLATTTLAVALVSAGTGVASAAAPTSVEDAMSRAQAHDGNPAAGMPEPAEAIVTGDAGDAAAGLVVFGVPIIFAVGLVMLF